MRARALGALKSNSFHSFYKILVLLLLTKLYLEEKKQTYRSETPKKMYLKNLKKNKRKHEETSQKKLYLKNKEETYLPAKKLITNTYLSLIHI